MAASTATQIAEWTEVAVAMDRCLRTFAEFAKPHLNRHGVPLLSAGNLLFLISIGADGVRVSDLIRRGRLLGSNASYALKSLQNSGLIERSVDQDDRRNAYVRWTESGRALASEIIEAGRHGTPEDSKEALVIVERFEKRFSVNDPA